MIIASDRAQPWSDHEPPGIQAIEIRSNDDKQPAAMAVDPRPEAMSLGLRRFCFHQAVDFQAPTRTRCARHRAIAS
jgi:hypothetical protein